MTRPRHHRGNIHLSGTRGDRIIVDDPWADPNELWCSGYALACAPSLSGNLMTGCSAFAIAASLPRPPVLFLRQSGGQLAEVLGFDVSRWNDGDADPVADIQRWKDWIMNGTGRF
jgi:hypothetical protein